MAAALRHPRVVFFAALVLLYLGVAAAMHRLDFPLYGDEQHYWPTTQRFAEHPAPDAAFLRDYPQLSTPLVFMIWGWLEAALHGGVQLGRMFDALVSLGILGAIVFLARAPARGAILAAVGLALFPYYVPVGVHLYPDTIACAFVLAGVVLYRRAWAWASAVAFALAIACRQFMVAFPAAVVAWELWKSYEAKRGGVGAPRPEGSRPLSNIAASSLAGFTLIGWFVFFGGFGPRSEVAHQAVSTASPLRVFPSYSLHALACVGAFFVIPETVLFRGATPKPRLSHRVAAFAAIGMAALFLAFPPLRNVDYGIESFGYFDKAVRAAVRGWEPGRMAIYWALATLAAWRFASPSFSSCLVLAHVLLMMKVNIAWEKYAMPPLVALWYLEAEGRRWEAPAQADAR